MNAKGLLEFGRCFIISKLRNVFTGLITDGDTGRFQATQVQSAVRGQRTASRDMFPMQSLRGVKRSDGHPKSLTFPHHCAQDPIVSLTESREDQVFAGQFYYSHGDIWNMSLTPAASGSLSCVIQQQRHTAVQWG